MGRETHTVCFEYKKQQHRIRTTTENSRETKRNETKILLKTECKEISMRYYLKKCDETIVTKCAYSLL